MPESHHPIQNHASGLTPAERRIAHRLDAIGRSEREAADASFEDRVFEVSRGHLPAPRPLNSPRIFASRARIALAASLVVAGGAVWFASQSVFAPSPTAPNGSQVALAELEAEVGFTLDALLASYSVERAGQPASSPANPGGSFWSSDSDPFDDFDEEISL